MLLSRVKNFEGKQEQLDLKVVGVIGGFGPLGDLTPKGNSFGGTKAVPNSCNEVRFKIWGGRINFGFGDCHGNLSRRSLRWFDHEGYSRIWKERQRLLQCNEAQKQITAHGALYEPSLSG